MLLFFQIVELEGALYVKKKKVEVLDEFYECCKEKGTVRTSHFTVSYWYTYSALFCVGWCSIVFVKCCDSSWVFSFLKSANRRVGDIEWHSHIPYNCLYSTYVHTPLWRCAREDYIALMLFLHRKVSTEIGRVFPKKPLLVLLLHKY